MKRFQAKKRRLRLKVYRGSDADLAGSQAGELLVEHFSDRQFREWKGRADILQEYHYLWWYELAAQQAQANGPLIEALKSSRPIHQDLAGWGRAIQYKYCNSPLSAIGSLKWVGGRFNYGRDIAPRYMPFPALYVAEDAETGIRELHGLTREDGRAGLTAEELALASSSSFTWFSIDGKLSNIFDLTKPDPLEEIMTLISRFSLSRRVRDFEDKHSLAPLRLARTADQLFQSMLTEHWRQYPTMFNSPANSQLFATWLIQAGFEGVKYISTKSGKASVAVFTRQFEHSDSVIAVVDPPAEATHCLLNRDTFKEAEET